MGMIRHLNVKQIPRVSQLENKDEIELLMNTQLSQETSSTFKGINPNYVSNVKDLICYDEFIEAL